jgi:hypothetical protein
VGEDEYSVRADEMTQKEPAEELACQCTRDPKRIKIREVSEKLLDVLKGEGLTYNEAERAIEWLKHLISYNTKL